VREAVKSLNIHPTQLYSNEELIGNVEKKEDGSVVFYGGDHKLVAYLNKHIPDTKPLLEQLKSKEDEISNYKSMEEDLKKAKLEQAKLSAVQKLDEVIKSKGLDDAQAAWIRKNSSKLQPSEDVDKSINDFINDNLDTYKVFVELHQDKFNLTNPPVSTSKPIPNEMF
jgi:hypothetical protein